MKLFKKLLVLLTMMAMLFGMSITSASASAQPGLAIDGKTISISSSYGTPFIDSANRMQVPIRVIAEKLGANVSWDKNTQTAGINGTIKIKVGSAAINTASGTITMDTTAVIHNGRVYIPLRAMANVLGFEVSATSQNGTVFANITTQDDLAQNIYVNSSWLKSKLGNVTVIDVRSAKDYDAGHIQGAINIYWTSLSNLAVKQGENGWAEVLDADALEKVLGSYGLDGETPIVIYGDPATGWGEDGRTLFTLNMAGINNACILDGGYSAWVASGLAAKSGL